MDDMKRKSHLVVRVSPECPVSYDQLSYDFIELCGSDLAANLEIGAETRESERDRKFASHTFNSLSKHLIATSL